MARAIDLFWKSAHGRLCESTTLQHTHTRTYHAKIIAPKLNAIFGLPTDLALALALIRNDGMIRSRARAREIKSGI